VATFEINPSAIVGRLTNAGLPVLNVGSCDGHLRSVFMDTIDYVNEFCYLGHVVNERLKPEPDVRYVGAVGL